MTEGGLPPDDHPEGLRSSVFRVDGRTLRVQPQYACNVFTRLDHLAAGGV